MKRTVIFLFLSGLHFFVLTAAAQVSSSYNLNFETYNTQQGLSDNVVLKTVQDKYGFLWLATHNGISRFDGLHFKNYTHNPADSNSLRSIWVTDLLIDDQQILWVTTEWGLCYYDAVQDRFKYVNERNDIQILYKAPLCKGAGNIIWVAAEDGLTKVDAVTRKYYKTSLKRIANPQFIVNAGHSAYIIGTLGNGLFKYNSVTDTYTEIPVLKIPQSSHFMDAVFSDEKIWIATDEGLLVINKDGSQDIYSSGEGKLHGKIINELMCVQNLDDDFGNQKLICGTHDKKLLLFDKLKKTFVYQWQSTETNPDGFPPAIIYNLYSSNKILWIATERGLCKLDMNSQQHQSIILPQLLANNSNVFVRKVIADTKPGSNLMWLLPWQPYNGIILYDAATQKIINEWNTAHAGKSKKYTDIIQLKNGTVVASRDSALDFISAKKGVLKTVQIKNKVETIYENEDGNLWLGAEKGLIFLDVKANTLKEFDVNFSGTDVERKSFAEDFYTSGLIKATDSTLWLASIKYGLFSFNITQKKYTAHRQQFTGSYSTQNRCSSVQITGTDSIWVGTMAGLACYIQSQDKFINYDISSGLKSAYIYSIIKDKYNNLWCRGNADVFNFNTATKKVTGNSLRPEFNVFSHNQNLSVNNDLVFQGHEGGFTIFNSNVASLAASSIPVAQIVACKVANENVFYNKDSCGIIPLKLAHTQNEISFDFTAIEFNHPGEIEYWYYLEGLDKDWVNGSDNRTINYKNLKFGTYRFKLFVSNKRNNTRSEITSFLFVIKPAFWQRWWFWPLTALLFMIAVVLVAIKNITQIKEEEKQKTASNKTMAELETKMLRSQMNPHFIFNSLNSVQKYIWENKEEDAAEYLARFAKLIRAILENSRKETIPLKEEIAVMKLYIELEHRRSNAHFDYTIKIDENLKQQSVFLPPLIMQPFIENAIWHGLNKKEAKGSLLVEVKQENNQLVCIIDDDGVGRNKKTENDITGNKPLGISITQQRISRLMQTTQQYAGLVVEDKIENGLATGTRVIITLPLQIQ